MIAGAAKARSFSRTRTTALALASGVAVAGCSLNLLERTECTTHAQCRDAFQVGWTCGDEGYCVEEPLPLRCARAYPEDLLTNPSAYDDHIILGSLFSFASHRDTLQATELAVRQVNQNGGLEGQRYAVLHCDYEPMVGDQLDDIEAVEHLAGYLADVVGVPAIIGPRGSSRTEAAFNAVRDDGVVIMSPSATSPALTALDGSSPTDEKPGFLWRTAPPDSLQSEVIAADMRQRGVTKTALIYQQGAYGDALANLFVTRFMQSGGETAEQFPYRPGGDFSAMVAQVAEGIENDAYEEVLFITSDIGDYVTFFRAATASPDLEAQYAGKLGENLPAGGIFLADAAYATMLLETAGPRETALFSKVRGTRPAPAQGVLYNSFAAAYTASFNESSTGSAYTPHSYDGAWLVIYATAWSKFNLGEITGLGIAQGLRRVSSDSPVDILPANWNTVVDHFRNGRSVDVQGASGKLDYAPENEETTAPIETWHIVASDDAPSGWAFETLGIVEP